MKVIVKNEIIVTEPTESLVAYCKKHLVISNPDYAKLQRLGKWTGNTPSKLYLYHIDGDTYYLPYGIKDELIKKGLIDLNEIEYGHRHPFVNIKSYIIKPIALYDYQEEAVNACLAKKFGILQSPAGSGKTQMGLALIQKYGCKTLWLTHTKDLLTQSKTRAAQYFDKSSFGEITNGKVNIGKSITFATVQTLAKQDMSIYADSFDMVIVDECHRVAGTPTTVTQFGKVISSLNAMHKFGLSATVHRADGLIKTTFAYLGDIAYQVPDEAVADKIMQVWINRRDTGIKIHPDCLDTDGTIIYQKLITYLTNNTKRNFLIANDLINNSKHYNLILSDRIEHLKEIMEMLPEDMCVMIDGTMTSKKGKAQREKALDDMRAGKKRYLFATYKLAKEGLDIPRLDRLYLATPQKDYAVVVQSVGRIARTFEGKAEPICYDYVDNIGYTVKAFKRRLSHYRKCNCLLVGGTNDNN